eukprot:8751304-Ditylum_brightwellii.AAC.1
MDETEQHFVVRDVTNFLDYYLGRDLIHRGNKIHVSTKKYVKEVLREFQDKFGTLAKENLPLRLKIYTEIDDSPLLNEEDHK